ncbi:hypothetical protein ACE1SV_53930 [Streptomyces sp. E-15]
MRHPPRSVLLSVTGAVALDTSAVVPVASAREATSARTVEYTVTGQWADGFQGSARITNDQAAPSTCKLTFDSAGGRHVTRGCGAQWSRSGTSVTAADGTWNGTLGTGASTGAGFEPRYGGAACVASVRDPVGRAEAHGTPPVLEPHCSYGRYTGNSAGCSDVRATCRNPMPDMRYAPAFRASVASAFKDDPATVFDLFNARTPARPGSSTRSRSGSTTATCPARGGPGTAGTAPRVRP